MNAANNFTFSYGKANSLKTCIGIQKPLLNLAEILGFWIPGIEQSRPTA
jgi:hypothetical protein